jgi:hypothetical protein
MDAAVRRRGGWKQVDISIHGHSRRLLDDSLFSSEQFNDFIIININFSYLDPSMGISSSNSNESMDEQEESDVNELDGLTTDIRAGRGTLKEPECVFSKSIVGLMQCGL